MLEPNCEIANVTISAGITLSDNLTRTDFNWYRGQEVETLNFTSTTNIRTRSVKWLTHTQNAGTAGSLTGAYFVGVQKIEATTYDTSNLNKTTRSEYVYDAYGNAKRQIMYGDIASGTSAEDCTLERLFVQNTTAWILSTPVTETLWPGTLTGATNGTPGSEKARSEYIYDGLTQ